MEVRRPNQPVTVKKTQVEEKAEFAEEFYECINIGEINTASTEKEKYGPDMERDNLENNIKGSNEDFRRYVINDSIILGELRGPLKTQNVTEDFENQPEESAEKGRKTGHTSKCHLGLVIT